VSSSEPADRSVDAPAAGSTPGASTGPSTARSSGALERSTSAATAVATPGAAAGAVLATIGAAQFKLATAAGLVAGGAAAIPTVLRAVSGFGVEAVLAAALLVLGHRAPRLALGLGLGAGLVAAVDVFFALVFGAPLTPAQRVWGHAADLSMVARGPLVLTLLAIVVVLVTAARAFRTPPRTRQVVVVVAALFAVAVVGRGFEHLQDRGTARRHAGLDDNPVLALLPLPPSAMTAAVTTSAGHVPGRGAPYADASLEGLLAVGDDDRHTDTDPSPVALDRSRRPRHIVLYVAESLAARFVDETTMPRLTALQHDRSLTFRDHVAPSPISIKAIFSLLCGLHPLPDEQLETTAIPGIACGSLPETLTAAGFDAALFHGGYFAFTDKLAFLGERGFQVLVDGENNPRRATAWTNGWGIDDRAVVDEALDWLDRRADPTRPSLLVVIPLIPHHEYFLPPDVPTPFGTRTVVDRYRNALRFADDVYARLVDGYRQRGLFTDSLFVFVGDHGEAFDEHPRNRLHGNFLYEENLRVPLVLTSPQFAAGASSDRPSSHADVTPTLLDLAGVPAPTGAVVQGQSLVAAGFRPRLVPLFTAVPTTRLGLRGPRWKYIHDSAHDVDELFDLTADPREAENRADHDGDRTAILRRRALAFADRQRGMLLGLPRKDAWLERMARDNDLPISSVMVFNMVRRCIPVTTSTGRETILRLRGLSPPARLVGFGIDDASRFAKKGAMQATVDHAGGTVVLRVDDRFASSSAVRDIVPSSDVTVRVAARGSTAEGPTGCLWLAP
jgi:hypothetical protein